MTSTLVVIYINKPGILVIEHIDKGYILFKRPIISEDHGWNYTWISTSVPITTKVVRIKPRSWRGVLDTTFCDVCQWLATGQWFSQGTPVSSTNKTDQHDIAEILLKVALNTINKPITNIEIILRNSIYENNSIENDGTSPEIMVSTCGVRGMFGFYKEMSLANHNREFG